MSWEEIELNSIAQIIAGQSPKSSFYNEGGKGLPFFQGNADFGVLNPKVRAYTSQVTKISTPNDLLISVRAPVGALNINNIECCIGRGLAAIRPYSRLSVKYLYYFLSQHRNKLKEIANGAVFEAVTTEQLKRIKVPLPPLLIQEKIANILDKADQLRRKDQGLQAKYDELAQAIFIDMFGDPVRNERGWDVKKLCELGRLDRGVSKHRPRNAPELLGGSHPLIQTGDIANSRGWITTYKATYSDFGLKQSKMWGKGTLCITIAANIAKTGILTFNACFPDSVVGFISNQNSNEIFVQYWFSFFQKALEDQAPESAQKNINLAILRSLDVIAPPISLQQAFAQKIEIINALKAKANAEKSEELFQSLLQRAFKGELVN